MEIGKNVSRKSIAYDESPDYATEEENRILQDLARHASRGKRRLYE